MSEEEDWAMVWDFKGNLMRLYGDEIYFIHTEQRKTYVHTRNKIYRINMKLNDAEQQMKGLPLIRTHSSFLVHMRHLERLHGYEMILKNGVSIPVSENRRKQVYSTVRSYLFSSSPERAFRIIKNANAVVDSASRLKMERKYDSSRVCHLGSKKWSREGSIF
ncbi:MAG: LytTR family DNA-binding domain-containing protein, partial [Brotaphodocola sp.]